MQNNVMNPCVSSIQLQKQNTSNMVDTISHDIDRILHGFILLI